MKQNPTQPNTQQALQQARDAQHSAAVFALTLRVERYRAALLLVLVVMLLLSFGYYRQEQERTQSRTQIAELEKHLEEAQTQLTLKEREVRI